MTIVPRTGPRSASSAFTTSSLYQAEKSSLWGVTPCSFARAMCAFRAVTSSPSSGLDSASVDERPAAAGGALARPGGSEHARSARARAAAAPERWGLGAGEELREALRLEGPLGRRRGGSGALEDGLARPCGCLACRAGRGLVGRRALGEGDERPPRRRHGEERGRPAGCVGRARLGRSLAHLDVAWQGEVAQGLHRCEDRLGDRGEGGPRRVLERVTRPLVVLAEEREGEVADELALPAKTPRRGEAGEEAEVVLGLRPRRG